MSAPVVARPGVRRGLATAATAAIAAVGLLGLAACDEGGSPVVEADPDASTTVAPGPSVTIPSDGAGGQPALWPTPGLVAFQSPEDAAGDFLEQVIGAGTLGSYRAGDTTSGEIDVLFNDVVRSTLLVRQRSAEEGWFVIAATNPNAAVTSPAAGATVPAGPLTVEGVGRGFEGTVVVRALAAGVPGDPLAEVIAAGGAQADPLPFTAELDLSAATPGQVVTLLVQGGTGAEDDPGDFGAIPVVIG